MSWGRSSEPAPPRAFMHSAESSVLAAITRAAAEQRWMVTREIDMNEIRTLYIKPEHREPLRLAFDETRFNAVDQSLQVSVPIPDEFTLSSRHANQTPVVEYKWDHNSAGEAGFFVPRYAINCVFQPDAPEELVEKYGSINARLQRIGYEWGLVKHVFRGLNVNGFCNTPAQMRFVWPAIRHLCDRFDKKLGDQLIDSSSRAGDKARVPPHIAPYLVETMHTVARSLLVDGVNMNEKRALVVNMGPVYYHAQGDHTFEGVV